MKRTQFYQFLPRAIALSEVPLTCAVSRATVLCWLVVLMLLASLNIASVNGSAAGAIIAIVAAALSVHSKYAFCLFMAAAQTVADPAMFPRIGAMTLTLSKVQIIAVAFFSPFLIRRFGLSRLSGVLRHLAPLVVLYTAVAVIAREEIPILFLSACLTCVVCAAMIASSETDWLFVLYSVAIGCGLASMGYWCQWLGIESVADVTADWVSGNYTLLRQASGRGDAPGTAAHLVVFMIGSIALSLVSLGEDRVSRNRRRLFLITALVSLGIGLPSLMGTYARLGALGLILCIPLLLWQGVCFVRDQSGVFLRPQRVLAVFGALCLLSVALVSFEPILTESSSVLLDRANRIAGIEGGGFLSGRLALWGYHLNLMLQSPAVGITSEEIASRSPDGHPLFAADGGMLESHNVFLHYGSHGGVVCFFLFLFLYLRPIRAAWKTARQSAIVFIAFYAATTVGLLTLTYVTWKVFWVQQAILWAFAIDRQRLSHDRSIGRGTRTAANLAPARLTAQADSTWQAI